MLPPARFSIAIRSFWESAIGNGFRESVRWRRLNGAPAPYSSSLTFVFGNLAMLAAAAPSPAHIPLPWS